MQSSGTGHHDVRRSPCDSKLFVNVRANTGKDNGRNGNRSRKAKEQTEGRKDCRRNAQQRAVDGGRAREHSGAAAEGRRRPKDESGAPPKENAHGHGAESNGYSFADEPPHRLTEHEGPTRVT